MDYPSDPDHPTPDLASSNISSPKLSKELEITTPKTASHKKNGRSVVLVPQPSSDPADPLNWPFRKKIIIFLCICLAGFAGQMSPNANQLTFTEQVPVYRTTVAAMLNSVAASLAGWMVGPFLFTPLAAVIGRSSVIFWSLIATGVCQIWGAEMTVTGDYISFALSRFVCGLFGVIPAIVGCGFIMDMFYLHQRGKAFAIFEVLIIFAVVGGATLGGFIAETKPWNYVFWWTLGPIGAATVGVFVFVEDTTYNRTPGAINRDHLPKSWVANRIATFFIGTKTQAVGRASEFKRRATLPLQITFAPITLLVGTFVFIALGLPIMQASTLAVYLQSPPAIRGYGFSNLQTAFFTMTSWVGIIGAQVYGYFFNDTIPLWVAHRRGGVWHPEYRLANTVLPGLLLPIGLGLWGVGIEFHLHFMVLALGSFLIWFAALLALPVCYNYIVECFVDTPVEASVALNSYRIAFGLMSVFIVTQWEKAVGVGWMWGMGALFIVLVDILMVAVIMKGHTVRGYTSWVGRGVGGAEDGLRVETGGERNAVV